MSFLMVFFCNLDGANDDIDIEEKDSNNCFISIDINDQDMHGEAEINHFLS